MRARVDIPPGGDPRLAEARCATGERATGGGAMTVPGEVLWSLPVTYGAGEPVGWSVLSRNPHDDISVPVLAEAICAVVAS